jgi:hypothetical protein
MYYISRSAELEAERLDDRGLYRPLCRSGHTDLRRYAVGL